MVSFPPCKVNLGLAIIRKRPDGFHDIDTCFYPLPFTDILEIIPGNGIEFTTSGSFIPGAAEDNLCLRAFTLLKRDHPLPGVRIHLHKIIPTGAGLGGGSSDAAHTIRLLDQIFKLGLTKGQQQSYAAQLGSDCSFFIQDEPCLGSGRGEELESFPKVLSGKILVLLNPGFHVSTADAYAGVTPTTPALNVASILSKPVKEWRSLLVNDFEKRVFEKFPLIAILKEQLYSAGAEYASMSGSGSSVYGVFDHTIATDNFPFHSHVIWKGAL